MVINEECVAYNEIRRKSGWSIRYGTGRKEQITKKEQPAKKRRKKETICTEPMAGDGGNLFTDFVSSLWD